MTIDIQLWLDPLGRMWLFFARISCAPRFLVTGFLRTQPTVLSNGDWVMCAYDRSSDHYCYARSSDLGITWVPGRAAKRLTNTFDENMILERQDGTLLMFSRDQKPLLTRCTASNLADSWSAGIPLCALTAAAISSHCGQMPEQAEFLRNRIMDEEQYLSPAGFRSHSKADTQIYNNTVMDGPSNWQ